MSAAAAAKGEESGPPAVATPANQQPYSLTTTPAPEKPKDRAASFAALLGHLGIGKGAVIAEIGAGKGQDTWLLAALVGDGGTVFSEEIRDASKRGQSLNSE